MPRPSNHRALPLLLPGLIIMLAGGGAAAAGPVPAPRPGAALRFMSGECDRLILAARRPLPCRTELVSLVYDSGAVSFVFSGADRRLLSFRTRIERRKGDQTLLRVTHLSLVGRGGSDGWSRGAKGTCLLTPFAVQRSRIDCRARVGARTYAAVFRTSEAAPRLVTLAGG